MVSCDGCVPGLCAVSWIECLLFFRRRWRQLVSFDCYQYSLEKFIGALVLLPDRQQENSRLCGAHPACDHGPEARAPLKLATSNDLHVLKLGSRVLIMAPSYALFYFASERKSSTRRLRC